MKLEDFIIYRQREIDFIYIQHCRRNKEISIDFLKENKKEDWEELGYYEDTVASMFLEDVEEEDMKNIVKNLGKICDLEYESIR